MNDLNKALTVLGETGDISPSQLKKKYKQLALKHHPDKGGDRKKFEEIKKAYDFLKGKVPYKEVSKSSPDEKKQNPPTRPYKQYTPDSSVAWWRNKQTGEFERNPYGSYAWVYNSNPKFEDWEEATQQEYINWFITLMENKILKAIETKEKEWIIKESYTPAVECFVANELQMQLNKFLEKNYLNHLIKPMPFPPVTEKIFKRQKKQKDDGWVEIDITVPLLILLVFVVFFTLF